MNDMKPGDLIGISGKKYWRRIPAHIAIVTPVYSRMVAYEFTYDARPTCVRTGRESPVGAQAHFVDDLVSLGRRVWHCKLCTPLYLDQEDRLLGAAEDCLGRGPDWFDSSHPWLTRLGLAKRLNSADFVTHLLRVVGICHPKPGSLWTPYGLIRSSVRIGIYEKPVRIA